MTRPDTALATTDEDREREEYLRILGDFPLVSDAADDPVQVDLYLDRRLEQLAELEAAAERNREIADRKIANVQAWLKSENETLEKRAGWLRLDIQAAAEGYDFGKKRSRNLPSGTFGYRKTRESVTVLDEAAAIDYATRAGWSEAIRVKTSLLKTELLKRVRESGEMPDGVEVAAPRDEFYVKTGG